MPIVSSAGGDRFPAGSSGRWTQPVGPAVVIGALEVPAPATVYVIDDDAGLRSGLADLLRSADLVVETFPSPAAFLEALVPGDTGCVLLDIRFPGGNGLDAQAQFTAAGITMPVILMTGHADVPSSVRGLKAGAVDFLVKPFEDEELFGAVSLALDREHSHRAAAAEHSDVVGRYVTLTPREREVLALVVTGLMNKQVAGKLGLSEITVKVHRGTMMRKMGVRTLADLVRSSEGLRAASHDTALEDVIAQRPR